MQLFVHHFHFYSCANLNHSSKLKVLDKDKAKTDHINQISHHLVNMVSLGSDDSHISASLNDFGIDG